MILAPAGFKVNIKQLNAILLLCQTVGSVARSLVDVSSAVVGHATTKRINILACGTTAAENSGGLESGQDCMGDSSQSNNLNWCPNSDHP